LAFATPTVAFAVSSVAFVVFRNLALAAIRKDYKATPESWSLLQSVYAMRDQDAASRSSILPLMRFIRYAPPSHKPDCVNSRHASAPSVVGYQTDESRSTLVVSHHLGGLLRKTGPECFATRGDHRVRCVSASAIRLVRPEGPPSLGVAEHPRNRVHTPRRIPLVSSRTASLRPLPS
jgi:hypothetical protein